MSGLLELAERVEAAMGPDRELDRAIGRVAGAAKEQPDGTWMTYHEDGYAHSINPPAYTESLDAAITLAPEGWSTALNCWARPKNPQRAWCASFEDVPIAPFKPTDFASGRAVGKTAALALCAAALRARATHTERTER